MMLDLLLRWLVGADTGDPDVPDGNIGSGPQKWWEWI